MAGDDAAIPAPPACTEDRASWYAYGMSLEKAFVEHMAFHNPGSAIRINPDKAHDPTVPDLRFGSGLLADLKTQNTPFFKASDYGLDPRYTWTFNEKDLIYYRHHYPALSIYVWLQWTRTTMTIGAREYRVEPMHVVYRIRLPWILRDYDAGRLWRHSYRRRPGEGLRDAQGNAACSLLIDLRRFRPLKQFRPIAPAG